MCVGMVAMKRQLQNRYAAPDEDVDLHVRHGVDLGGVGSPTQHGVTQHGGLSHSANCKA